MDFEITKLLFVSVKGRMKVRPREEFYRYLNIYTRRVTGRHQEEGDTRVYERRKDVINQLKKKTGARGYILEVGKW